MEVLTIGLKSGHKIRKEGRLTIELIKIISNQWFATLVFILQSF